MEQQRIFLWIGLFILLWLNVTTWMKDDAAHQAVAAPAPRRQSTIRQGRVRPAPPVFFSWGKDFRNEGGVPPGFSGAAIVRERNGRPPEPR